MSKQHKRKWKNKSNNNYSNNYSNKTSSKSFSSELNDNFIKYSDNPIKIDGSILEGGGQIIRNSMTLSSLLQQSVYIYNIRGKRSTPGLRPQHCLGNTIINNIFNGKLLGNSVKSMNIYYKPGNLNNNNKINEFYGDTKTAGSITLLLQTCLPCLLYLKNSSQLILKGGTDVSFSPPIDFFKYVLTPILSQLFNINIKLDIKSRGFYPKGGGHIILQAKPIKYLNNFNILNRGKITKISGYIIISGKYYTQNDINWMVHEIKNKLNVNFNCIKNKININNINVEYCDSRSDGLNMLLIIETENKCLISNSCNANDFKYKGETNVEYLRKIINKCVNGLISDFNQGNTCTDRYLQDQLIIFMALAKGISKLKTCNIELHTKTAMHFIELLTGAQFKIIQCKDGGNIIQCNGIGLLNKYFKNNNDKDTNIDEDNHDNNDNDEAKIEDDVDDIDANDESKNVDSSNTQDKNKEDFFDNRQSFF